MSSPPGIAPTLTPRTSAMEDVSDFAAACRRRDYPALQASLAGLPRKAQRENLTSLFSHLSNHWIDRHLHELLAMDPEHFWELAYADPTGTKAARNIDNERSAA